MLVGLYHTGTRPKLCTHLPAYGALCTLTRPLPQALLRRTATLVNTGKELHLIPKFQKAKQCNHEKSESDTLPQGSAREVDPEPEDP